MTGEHHPGPGDYTVCIECASVLRWDEEMNLHLAALIDVPVEIRFQFVRMIAEVQKWRDALSGSSNFGKLF